MKNKVNIGKDLYLKGRIGWRGLSKDEYLEHSLYRIINATALLDNKINWDNCGYISQERFDESKEIILQEDDILISKDGTLGKIGFVKNKPRFATVASGIFVLRNTKKDILDTTYLYHFLKSNIFKDFIKRNKANGSTINHLYQRDLVRLDLDLPSIKGQQRIGSILSNIDEKIELNNKINAELENIAKTLYDYWFVQFDFPDENNQPYKSNGGKMVYNEVLKKQIPYNWNNGTISDIITSQTGYAFKSQEWTDLGHPVLTIKSIENNSINLNETSFIESYNEKYSKYTVNNGNIILAMTGNTIGKIGIIASKVKNILINQRICIYKTDCSNIAFLYFNLLEEAIQNKIWQIAQNSSQPNISEAQLKALPIVIPDNKLLQKYNLMQSNVFQTIIKNKIENQELTELRDFLLPMLMNGQVTVSDKIENNLSEEKIIEKSLEFWKTHGKMDIDKFARENGILVYKDNEQKKGAVSYNAEKDLYEIAVKDPRDNFTIAHEIGHILKHKKELKTGTLGRKSEESGSKIMEYEADFLAAEILMPEEYVMKYLKEYKISNKDYLDEKFVKSCAKNFDVTPPAMNIRLKNLGYKVPYLK